MQQPVRLAAHEWPVPADQDVAADWPVAVLVHGITGWWRTWWRVGPALVDRGWRVIGIDLRGHGDSPPIAGVATAPSVAADLGATLDALGVAPLDLLLGHSLGAAVCMELVHGRPEIARRAAFEDPPGQTRADDTAFQDRLAQDVRAARTNPEAEVQRELAENPLWMEEDARQNVEGRARCDLEGILASLRGDTGVRAPDLARMIRTPSLYLIADADRSVLGTQRQGLLDSLPPQATALEFDSGHTIHRARFDAYVTGLLEWIEA